MACIDYYLFIMKCSPRTLILVTFWVFWLVWIYLAIEKYQNEDTSFNHYDKSNGFQWPVVNICDLSHLFFQSVEFIF